jgi:hypothetical protein
MDSKHHTPAEAMGGHAAPAPLPVIPPGTIAYEKTDADVRSVARIVLAIAVMTACAAGIAFGLFRLLGERAERNDPPAPPLSRPADGRRAPEPRLQTAPAADLAAVREEEQRLLAGYGWADEAAGVARIPIEEAMSLYVTQATRPGAVSPPPSAPPLPSPAPPAQAHP